MFEFAAKMRPLFAASIAEHEKLMREAGAERYLRTNGWLKIYRTTQAFNDAKPDLDAIAAAGLAFEPLDTAGSMVLEPGLSPIFERGIYWPQAAERQQSAGGDAGLCRAVQGAGRCDRHRRCARSLHRADGRWRVDTTEGPVDGTQAVVALGPWAQDVLDPLGIKLPLEMKRGYHRHFKPKGNKGLNRPVLDAEVGYAMVPMEQGLRLTTGAEFASATRRRRRCNSIG